MMSKHVQPLQIPEGDEAWRCGLMNAMKEAHADTQRSLASNSPCPSAAPKATQHARRIRQRLRKKEGREIAVIDAPSQEEQEERLESQPATHAETARPEDSEHAEGAGVKTSTMAEVCARSKDILSKAWQGFQVEFEVQVLIWKSLPRNCQNGNVELGVLVEAGVEAYMLAVMEACLNIAQLDPLLAASTIQSAQKQPEWDANVLNIALSRSIEAVAKAKKLADCMTGLSQHVLASGRTVVAGAGLQKRTCAEVAEIDALFAATGLQACDLHLVRHAFRLPEAGKKSAISDRALPSRWTPLKYRVKNTFVDVEPSSDSEEDCCGRSGRSSLSSRSGRSSRSSVRSLSVPWSLRSSASCASSESER